MKSVGIASVLVFVALVVGYFIGASESNTQEDLEDDVAVLKRELDGSRKELERSNDVYEDVKGRYLKLGREFDEIAHVDYAEYLRLKDSEVKLAKLEEIMGKIFLLFLNHVLEFKPPKDQIEYAKRAAKGETGVQNDGRASTSSESSKPSTASLASESSNPSESSEASKSGDANWLKAEKQLEDLSEKDFKKYLEETVLADPTGTFNKSDLIKKRSKTFDKMQGHYEGVINVFNRPNEKWTVEFDCDGEITPKGPKGHFAMKVFKNDREVSGDTSNGNLKIRGLPEDSSAILLTIGRKRFFQLYYVPLEDQFIGNYYEISGVAELKHRGTFRLTR